MTLSLDDVRNKRFRMARKSGYEVLEVDEFVDEIEESFGQLIEENQNLKKQVSSLRSTGADAAPAQPVAAAEPASPSPAAAPADAQSSDSAPQPVVVTTAKEASSAVVRLVQLSTEQAERLVAEAGQEADRIRKEAGARAQQLTTDARTRAEQLESEARVNAERVQAQTTTRSQQLDREVSERRAEMLNALSKQREQLSASVRELRSFEAAYRANLTQHLKSQITTIESGRAEPSSVPELADVQTESSPEGASTGDASGAASPAVQSEGSETPRLDALLGEQR